MWPDCIVSIDHETLETHEIIGGFSRSKAIEIPAALLRLCRSHHADLPSRPNQELLVKLLAIKQHCDREHANVADVVLLWRPNCQPSLIAEMVGLVNAKERELYGDAEPKRCPLCRRVMP